jgi:hypothetical protein
MTCVPTENIHIGLIEHNAKQIITDAMGMAKSMFNDVDFGATPFNDKNK